MDKPSNNPGTLGDGDRKAGRPMGNNNNNLGLCYDGAVWTETGVDEGMMVVAVLMMIGKQTDR